MKIELPGDLESYERGSYWGVTPASILLYNNAVATREDEAWRSLHRYYDLTAYVSNHAVEWDTYRMALDRLHGEWFDSTTVQLAQHATDETAKQFVLGAAYEAEGGVMRLLRLAQEIFAADEGSADVVLSRSDVRSISEEDDQKILRSFNTIRSTTEGVKFRRGDIRCLRGSRHLTKSEAGWAVLARICQSQGVGAVETVVPALLKEFGIEPPEDPPDDISGSLPIYAGDARIKEFVDYIHDEDIVKVLKDVSEKNHTRAKRLEQTLGLASPKPPIATPSWPISDRSAAVCALASQHQFPVASGWILNDEGVTDRFSLRRKLDEAGFEVSLEDTLLTFGAAYDGPDSHDAIADYEEYVATERRSARMTATGATQLTSVIQGRWNAQRLELLASSVDRLDALPAAPIHFVFTMFDPVFHADEYEIDEYIGESPHLADEVTRIEEWRANQPHDAVSFPEKVREMCGRPIEDSSVAPQLRIMSPWTNFTIKEYTALFQRLLDNDVNVKLLTRLPDPGDWTDLKRNLLTRLGDTGGNLEIRTYTRYKKFKDHTQLRKLRRDKADDEGDTYVSETGVHAKLFIVGQPENGAVLAGSANLMENSFYYNPEAGLHTRHPEVVETSIDYFDLIWDLAEPDKIDESVFTGATNFEFYPKVYRP